MFKALKIKDLVIMSSDITSLVIEKRKAKIEYINNKNISCIEESYCCITCGIDYVEFILE